MTRRVLLIAVCFAAVSAVRADVFIPPPGIERIVQADAVIVGKVIGIEPVDLEFPVSKDSPLKFHLRIAVVSVSETIVGARDAKMLRVGFVPAGEKNRPFGFFKYPELNFKLDVGDHGLMYLRKRPDMKVYYGTLFNDFNPLPIDANPKPAPGTPARGSYVEEVKRARQVAKLLDDPRANLQAKDPLDRCATAAALLVRYRSAKVAKAKTELVSLEETRLIMNILLEQDWKATTPTPTPWNCFLMLGLREADGWTSPGQINDLNDVRAAARTWYRERADTYRIPRFLAESAK